MKQNTTPDFSYFYAEEAENKQVNRAAEKKLPKPAGRSLLLAAVLVTALIFLLSLLTLTAKGKTYSENENRYLAGKPQFSLSSLLDGKFMKDTESYLSDRFAGRDFFVSARARVDLFVGKKEINDVYVGKEHFLFEKPVAYEEARMEKTLGAINAFTKKHAGARSYIAVAPTSASVLKDFMPKNAPTQDQSAQIQRIYKSLDGVSGVDITTTLMKEKDRTPLFYRTDHHWTTKGAGLAFYQLAAAMKLDTSKTPYQTFAVTNDFQGTLASYSGLFNARDTITITVPKNELPYTVTYVDEKKTASTLFDPAKLEQKNKYDLFFGGNFAQIRIDTAAKTERTLLLFKDSYANCLVPMLLPHFKTIIMVDPRYYQDDAEQLFKKDEITDILWLYNINTLLNDTSVASALEQ